MSNNIKINDEAIRSINELFMIFCGLFPSSYYLLKEQANFDNCKRQWIKAFIKNGIINSEGKIDNEMIRIGYLNTTRLNQLFMPSFGQFLELCEIETTPSK